VQVSDTIGDSYTDHEWLAGQVLETDTYSVAGGTVVRKQVAGPWTYNQTADQSQPGGLPDLTAHMLAASQGRTVDLFAGGTWRTAQVNAYYNSHGLVAAVDAAPFGSAETCTTTSYATAPTGNTMMTGYPYQVATVTGSYTNGSCPAATASNIVSGTRTFYDDSSSTLSSMGTLGTLSYPGGLVTGTQRAISWASGGNETWQAVSATGYDALGRVTSAVAPTPAGASGTARTSTAYTPAYAAGAAAELPTRITVTNPLGWVTATTLDQGRELPLTVTDPNSEATTEAYDPLGRLTSVIVPRDQASGDKSEKFAYSITGTDPSAVTTSTLREDGSYSTDVKIYDGMLQLRQDQATPANAAAGRVITDTFYDSHGWVVKSRKPYHDATTAPGTTMFLADDGSIPGWTATGYDGQGRVTSSAFFSGTTRQWATSTAYPASMRPTSPRPSAALPPRHSPTCSARSLRPGSTPPPPPTATPRTRTPPATPTPRRGSRRPSPTTPGTPGPTVTTWPGTRLPPPIPAPPPHRTGPTTTQATWPRPRTPAASRSPGPTTCSAARPPSSPARWPAPGSPPGPTTPRR